MRKIGIIGSGESGIGAALLAQSKGEPPFVSDFGTIDPVYRQILIENNVRFEEGGHSFEILVESDLIVKSPGVPDNVKIIRDLKQAGLTVISELEYAFQYRKEGAKIIGITGSNGKTTTTNLTHHLLDKAGVISTKGGNLGTCFSNLLLGPDFDVYVLEISSYQLDGIIDFRPDIAMLLNITPDHLDRYEYDFNLYAQSKMRIFMNQKVGDYALYNADDREIMSRLNIDPELISYGISSDRWHSSSFTMSNAALRGDHNAYNASFAIQTARLLGVDDETIQEGLNDFKNDDHRMQLVAVIDDVEWINDSKATNVDSTYYALKAMDKPVIWIAGGIDKGNDYSVLMPFVHRNVKVLIAMGKDNTKIINAFEAENIEIVSASSMGEALTQAKSMAQKGEVVLLSPACASFDLFKNYVDRGHQFITGVYDLIR